MSFQVPFHSSENGIFVNQNSQLPAAVTATAMIYPPQKHFIMIQAPKMNGQSTSQQPHNASTVIFQQQAQQNYPGHGNPSYGYVMPPAPPQPFQLSNSSNTGLTMYKPSFAPSNQQHFVQQQQNSPAPAFFLQPATQAINQQILQNSQHFSPCQHNHVIQQITAPSPQILQSQCPHQATVQNQNNPGYGSGNGESDGSQKMVETAPPKNDNGKSDELQKFSRENAELKAKIRSVRPQMEQLHAQVATLNKENFELRVRIGQLSALERANADLQKQNDQLTQGAQCSVCWDSRKEVIFMPCLHFTCCKTCADGVDNCPICRQNIMGKVKFFQ